MLFYVMNFSFKFAPLFFVQFKQIKVAKACYFSLHFSYFYALNGFMHFNKIIKKKKANVFIFTQRLFKFDYSINCRVHGICPESRGRQAEMEKYR